ncbi:MAG: LysR family transcriptional regulator [Chloroflexaceae bacterium]|nr:LysR family transcriptional regulator [Chloroflexaceae bacterium]NJO05256.1 LysR family transcriptional regulator [Chloroflexaceae bacterium]
MELRHLRYFEAVARHSHVTRASEELHIAQPALSKQISQLEQELDVALFNRVGRSVRLTEAGEALLPHARAILAQVEAARAEMAERVGLRRGRVAVGTTPTVGTRLLPRALAAFSQQYPGIDFRLHEAGVQTLVELLETGTADLVVVALPVDDPALTVAELFSEEMIVVTSTSHPLAGQATVALSDLRTERWVLTSEDYELRNATVAACERAGYTPHVVLEGGEIDMLLQLVAAGVGISLLPRLGVPRDDSLAVLPVSDQKLQRTLGLAWRDDRVAPPAARALRQFLAERLRIEAELLAHA